MKLDSKTLLSHGAPSAVRDCIQKEFGASLPLDLVEEFTCKPGAVVVFRCRNGLMTGVVRQPSRIITDIRSASNNVKAILYWQEAGGTWAKVLEDWPIRSSHSNCTGIWK